jgi:hypothetical protein
MTLRNSFRGVGWSFLFILAAIDQEHLCSSFLPSTRRSNKLFFAQSKIVITRSFTSIGGSWKTFKTTASHDVSQQDNKREVSTTTRLLSSPTRRPLRDYKAAVTRKPHGYWTKLENVEKELRDLWIHALTKHETKNNSTAETVAHIQNYLPSNEPPPIPNVTLLRYWKQNYLAYYIQKHGKEELSDILGGAVMIPGKWKDAIKLPLMRRVVELDGNLSLDSPPPSMSQQRILRERENEMDLQANVWKDARYGPPLYRKMNGYWTKQQVITELYVLANRICRRGSEACEVPYTLVSLCSLFSHQYLEQRKQDFNIPSVWMPRMAELVASKKGWATAVTRHFGSSELLRQETGLVPFHEWNYFEGQYDLMLTLREYCDEHLEGDYSVFPQVSHLREQGQGRLVRLIQENGGSIMIASRLGMIYRPSKLSWGSFDLEFGIALMGFLRGRHLRSNPPLHKAGIFMPTRAEVLNLGTDGLEENLHEKITRYGGYENVARRLGLAWEVSKL